jgi:dGTPase
MAPVRRSEALVGDLFDRYFASADMPGRWGAAARGAQSDGERARITADFIAGMTDPYAEAEHVRLFDGRGPVE